MTLPLTLPLGHCATILRPEANVEPWISEAARNLDPPCGLTHPSEAPSTILWDCKPGFRSELACLGNSDEVGLGLVL